MTGQVTLDRGLVRDEIKEQQIVEVVILNLLLLVKICFFDCNVYLQRICILYKLI